MKAVARRIAGWLPLAFGLLAMIAVFDWIDYHVKGKSAFYGINPRCARQFLGDCIDLRTTDLPWDAIVAHWLDQAIVFLMIGLMIVGAGAAIWLAADAVTRRLRR